MKQFATHTDHTDAGAGFKVHPYSLEQACTYLHRPDQRKTRSDKKDALMLSSHVGSDDFSFIPTYEMIMCGIHNDVAIVA